MTLPEPLDALLAQIHACPGGLTCRPGRGVLYPLPPEGDCPPEGPDVLLLGWNPRHADVPRHALPPPAEWRRDAREALARFARDGSQAARDLQTILPPTHALESGRVMRTHLWKWPTRFKTSGGESAFYARRCMESHFERELDALRPRVLVTFHAEAAREMAQRAEALGIGIRPPHPLVRRQDAAGWTLPHDAWGWPMGLVLLQDADPAWAPQTREWAAKAIAHVLAHTPPKTLTGRY